MRRKMALERCKAVTTSERRLFTKTMSAASIAISAPAPMAIPRSAWANAGASLTPSPTIATNLRPSSTGRTSLPRKQLVRAAEACGLCCKSFTFSAFPEGRTPATTFSGGIPTRRAMAAAVRALSPVSMNTSRPMRWRAWIVCGASSFTVSARATRSASTPSTATKTTVLPSSSSSALSVASRSAPSARTPFASIHAMLPMSTWCSRTEASRPRPGKARKVAGSTKAEGAPRSARRRSASCATAWPRGCSLPRSALPASRSNGNEVATGPVVGAPAVARCWRRFVSDTSSSRHNTSTSVTRGFPSVIVPVLSKTTASIWCAASKA
mmetsp:Transcript_18325/g.43417  ORF Transcript_18325/g.43417 Transcript_18325/m.43417 type:complete len:325 (+) Transcript_18325:565-1539(+)